MTWQEQLFTSFIKGIGKTTGGLVLVGVVTGIWVLTERRVNLKMTTDRQTQVDNYTDTDTDTETETDTQEKEDTYDPNRIKKLLSRM